MEHFALTSLDKTPQPTDALNSPYECVIRIALHSDALAGFALALDADPSVPQTLWPCLQQTLQARCPYCVPYYVPKPAGGSNDEWKRLLGYRRKGDGKAWEDKSQYYARVAGYVTLYGALLQQSWVPRFQPPREDMEQRPTANPLGLSVAWTWLARVVNQPPRQITATILMAFLKPCAHALLRAYPRQFAKLLRLVAGPYSAKMHALVDGPEKPPEEQAALMTLDGWLKETLAAIDVQQTLPLPAEADMPAFKAPDDTSGGGDDDYF